MKRINCDLCKREIGVQVDKGNFISWGSGASYSPSSFYVSTSERLISDLCSECFIKIADAQNKVIEELNTLP